MRRSDPAVHARPEFAGRGPAGGVARCRRGGLLMLALVAALALGGCRVQRVLTPSLPPVAGTTGVGTTATQVFYSPVDGLDRLTIGLARQEVTAVDGKPTLTGGATVEVRYAAEADARYPEPDFHAWPAQNQWLDELTGDRVVGQSFRSLYPNLDGITLRAATFGGDVGPGEGRLSEGGTVPVLALPVDGALVTALPGGSTVRVEGAAEGWAAVRLDSGLQGYIELSRFAELPPPLRVNDKDVTLTLYREPDLTVVRTATINAADINDNSHVTFRFDPIPDSAGARYRFTIASPQSLPGNAVTFRYSPSDVYADGSRFDGNKAVPGDLIFAPTHAEGDPLYAGSLDEFGWSDQTSALEGRFPPISGTADRFLKIVVTAGQGPLVLNWSEIRPPGGVPMEVAGDPAAPKGGLVFNVGYLEDVRIRLAVEQVAGRIRAMAGDDPWFFALYGLVLTLTAGWGGWLVIRKDEHGR